MAKQTLASMVNTHKQDIHKWLEQLADKIMERGTLTDLIPESGFDVQLSMAVYKNEDGDEKLKLIVDIGTDDQLSIDEDSVETIADTVSDDLKERLGQQFVKIGIDLVEELDWTTVTNNSGPLT